VLTDADYNTALGYAALSSDTLGSKSVALGWGTLLTQNFTSATDVFNTAVGHAAGEAVTTGVQNTLIGGLAGDALTDADGNVALGTYALSTDTLGSRAVAIGHGALVTQNFTSATNNYNVGVGHSAGYSITTGTNNTLLGGLAGDSITTGSNNILIGFQSEVSSNGGSNQICIGIDINAGGDNNFSFGKASNIVTNDFDADANWSRSSDQRLKKNITDQTLGLSFINDLRTVKYNWKASHELDSSDSQLAHLYKADSADNEMNTAVTMHNFIAQEVKTALDTAGVSDFSGWKEDEYGVQQVSREMFVIPLVKAIQELSAQVEALTARIETLEG